jgi:hypothetical protein
MKLIKFDLNINGIKVRTLDALQDNLTSELVTLYKKGTLQRWLQSYGFDAEKDSVAGVTDNGSDKKLLVSLGAALGVDIPDEVAEYMLEQSEAAVAAQSEAPSAGEPAEPASTTEPASEAAATSSAGEAAATDESHANAKPSGFDCWDDAQKTEYLSRQDIDAQWQEELLHEGEPAIRQALAKNPCLGERWQLYLCETGSKEIRSALAANISIKAEVQSVLATAKEWAVREALAANPALVPELHEKISVDSDSDVRLAFLSNPCLTEAQQEQKYNLAVPSKMPHKYGLEQERAATAIVVALAKNRSLSPALQARFMGDLHFGINVSKVRAALAGNAAIGEKIQSLLLASGEEAVLRSLASNSSLTIVFQHELRAKGSVEVRVALCSNASVKAEVKAKAIQSLTKNDLDTLKSRLDMANSEFQRRWDHYQDAQVKAMDYGSSGFLWSEEKRKKLDRDVDLANYDRIVASDKAYEVSVFFEGLKKIIAEKDSATANAAQQPIPAQH